jgi:hypothetical protein
LGVGRIAGISGIIAGVFAWQGEERGALVAPLSHGDLGLYVDGDVNQRTLDLAGVLMRDLCMLMMSVLSGFIFALGLGFGGMTDPSRVLDFLNVTGSWDATLLGVMGGAVSVYAVASRLICRRKAPICAAQFEIPTHRQLSCRLFLGAAIFGVGWGSAGYCPGPLWVSLASGNSAPLWAGGGMLFGILLALAITRAKP